MFRSHSTRLLGGLGICATVAAGALAAFAIPAAAKNGNSAAHEHVTICHATPPDTAANGYVQIAPSASGVYHGHVRQHDADIIPPLTYKGATYSENWDATGQAIWNNGCVAPAQTAAQKGAVAGGVAGARVTHRAGAAKPVVSAASFTG